MNQMMGNMNMNMNQAGMSSTLMTNFAMDNTAMKIKAIIDPYEKKIIDLEKIIRQKDFEILVLKEKLNNYKNSQINQMGMNNNNNQMNMGNQMGMGMNNNNNQMNMGNQMGMGINNNQMGMNMGNQMGMGMNNNQMGMNMGNQMGMGMNMNIGNDMNMMNNQMPPMMNQMMNPVTNNRPMWMWHYNNLNDNQNLNDENNSSNKINIVFRRSDDNPPIRVMCDYTEKISEVIKRYFIKAGIDSKYHKYFKFIHNAKNLNLDLTVAENGIINNSTIFVIKTQNIMIPRNHININLEQNNENKKEKRIHVKFITTKGMSTYISFNENGSIRDLLFTYFKRIDRPELINRLMNRDLVFIWNGGQLKINDTRKVKDFFKNDMNPEIVVNDIQDLIGA